ncbi:AAA family ATPase [Amycolatopsis circi]|uniref:AAA family ATPase n=1 Tax=Amycolatopsis circi TaxID=871959 RepID=UPI0013BEAAE3|nr:AAA family ATPase [Amycolatopsis circi]
MTLYAIGGSSSVGKTTVAEHLAARHDIAEVIHVDNLRTRDVTARPAHSWLRPDAELLDALLASTAQIQSTLAAELDRLSKRGGHVIIEGEGVQPDLLHRYAHLGCRAVYLIESEERTLRTTLATRPSNRRFLALPPREQRGAARMNYLYGQWLRTQAERYQQSWLPSQPWTTLGHRVEAHLLGA